MNKKKEHIIKDLSRVPPEVITGVCSILRGVYPLSHDIFVDGVVRGVGEWNVQVRVVNPEKTAQRFFTVRGPDPVDSEWNAFPNPEWFA